MIKPHQRHSLWLAYFLHRSSGLGLALFLPAHFYILGFALSDQQAFDGMLDWTDNWPVKIAEIGLVFLLAVHFFGGIRLLALEFLPWQSNQKTFAALAVAISFFIACMFGLNVFI